MPSGVFTTNLTAAVLVPIVFSDNCTLFATLEVNEVDEVDDLVNDTLVKFFVEVVVL